MMAGQAVSLAKARCLGGEGAAGALLETQTTTSVNGSFTFSNLPGGLYIVSQVGRAGQVSTLPQSTNLLGRKWGQWNGRSSTGGDGNGGQEDYASIWVAGNLAFLGHAHAENGDGVEIIDVTDRTQPRYLTTWTPPEGDGSYEFEDVKVVDGVGYCCSDNTGKVYLIDVAGILPLEPGKTIRLLSTITTGLAQAHTCFLQGNRLYISDSSTANVKVFNVTNPESPVLFTSIQIPASGNLGSGDPIATHDPRMHDGYAEEDVAYLYDIHLIYGGLYVVDMTRTSVGGNVGLPVHYTKLPAAHSCWLSPDRATLAVAQETGNGQLNDNLFISIFDVTAPYTPVLKARLRNPFRRSLCPHNPVILGNVLYASWYDLGALAFDLTNPSTPCTPAAYFDPWICGPNDVPVDPTYARASVRRILAPKDRG
jgi:hypothetical protein